MVACPSFSTISIVDYNIVKFMTFNRDNLSFKINKMNHQSEAKKISHYSTRL